MADSKVNKMLNMICLLSITQELNEGLKGTTGYRHKIKQHSKILEKELDKFLDVELSRIWSADEEIMLNILRNKEQLFETLSELALKANADDFLFANQLIQMYLNNKEEFNQNIQPIVEKLNS